MTNPAPPFILIDGSGWLFRAYHALPDFNNSKGEPTGAVFGMGNMLRKLLRDHPVTHIAVVLDAGGETFRHRLHPAYKANRPPIPDALRHQFESIGTLANAMGLPVLRQSGIEADDIIGTLATQAAADGADVLIITSDKDMAQLVNDRVTLLDTLKNRRLDVAGVVEKFGVPPERIIDFLALMGDSSDNIPGVPKVGEKTAAKLLGEFGSLDALMQRAEEVPGKLGENLRAALAQLPLSRQLTTIDCQLPLEKHWKALTLAEPNPTRLKEVVAAFEFKQWLAELDKDTNDDAAAESTRDAPQQTTEPNDYRCVLDDAEFGQLLTALQHAPLICFDSETDALDPHRANLVGLAFAVQPSQAWYLPLAHDYLGAPPQLDRRRVLDALRPILEDATKPKLAQHGKYDCEVLARHGITVRGLTHDTMLESYVLNATANRHDMDTLALQHLNHQTIAFTDVAGKGKHQLTFNQVTLDRATPYSAEDADITLRLHHALYPQLESLPSLLKLYRELEMPLVPVLTAVETRGVLVDAALLSRISVELADRMRALEQQAWQMAQGEFNLGSPNQLAALLFDKLQLPVLAKTPKGQPSTNEDVLEQLTEKHPLPRLILDWRSMAKLRSTYTDKLPQQINPHTGRVHTSYHQAVASTGRLSSTDPNLQNIPVRTEEGRRIRQAFIAPTGYVLASIDYSQIELRLMAHLSGDPSLTRAFHDGRDIHQATAAEVFDLPLTQVTSEQRRAAKAINFGLIYGMSAFGLARQLGIDRGEAQSYLDRFFARYPGVRDFMETTKRNARDTGYVETLFGRRLYLPDLTSRNPTLRQYAERTAINAPLQGTAADLIKIAMIDCQRWLNEQAPDCHMVMQVHDELVFEIPEARAAEVAQQLGQRMCAAATFSVPLQADYGIGANWDAAHQSSHSVRSA